MRRTFLIILTAFAFNLGVFPQDSFFKTIDLGGSDGGISILEFSSGNLFLTSTRADSAYSMYFLLSSQGEVLDSLKVAYPNRWGYARQALMLPDDRVCQLVTVQNPDYSTEVYGMFFSETMDTVEFGPFSIGTSTTASFPFLNADGSIISTGWSKPTPGARFNFYALKIDEQGNLLWQNEYPSSTQDLGQAVAPTRDGGYLLSGTRYRIPPGYIAEVEVALIIKIDSLGNFLWQKEIVPFGDEAMCNFNNYVHPVTDSTFMIFGTRQKVQPYEHRIWVALIDEEGNLISERDYWGETSVSDAYHPVLDTEDGGFLLPGISRYAGRSTMLLKLDSNLDSLWLSNIYSDPVNFYQNMYGVSLARDGGILIAGSDVPDGSATQDIFYARVNPCGQLLDDKFCFTAQPGISLQEKDTLCNNNPKQPFVMFPNPADESVGFRFCSKGEAWKNMEVFDALGRVVFQSVNADSNPEIVINTSIWNPGIYFCRVTTEGKGVATRRFFVKH